MKPDCLKTAETLPYVIPAKVPDLSTNTRVDTNRNARGAGIQYLRAFSKSWIPDRVWNDSF